MYVKKVEKKTFRIGPKRCTLKAIEDYKAYKEFGGKIFDVGKTKELEFTFNVVKGNWWRVIHNDGKILSMFYGEGTTYTLYDIFYGTESQCINKIRRMKRSGELTSKQIKRDTEITWDTK